MSSVGPFTFSYCKGCGSRAQDLGGSHLNVIIPSWPRTSRDAIYNGFPRLEESELIAAVEQIKGGAIEQATAHFKYNPNTREISIDGEILDYDHDTTYCALNFAREEDRAPDKKQSKIKAPRMKRLGDFFREMNCLRRVQRDEEHDDALDQRDYDEGTRGPEYSNEETMECLMSGFMDPDRQTLERRMELMKNQNDTLFKEMAKFGGQVDEVLAANIAS